MRYRRQFMNIVKRECRANARQTMFWIIGLLCLLFMSFYKMQGIASAPGGINALMKSFPPVLQAFFGSTNNAGTGIGAYEMIHMYMCIALALHAALLGASIFSKEERDKTFEFLYVKGVTRYRILMAKILAGMLILFALILVTLLGIYASVAFVGYTLVLSEIVPYLCSLFLLQLSFFSIALLLSLLIRNSQKAGMMGCCIALVMFLITMYVKMGGQIEFLDACSLFHYTDTSYILSQDVLCVPYLIILVITCSGFGISEILHNRRDLLN